MEENLNNISQVTEENLIKVFANIIASSEAMRNDKFKSVMETEVIKNLISQIIKKPTSFEALLVGPMKDLTDVVLDQCFPHSPRVHFLLKEYDFIKRHIKNVFQEQEGISCCVDKTLSVMRALMGYYTKAKEIEFNYNAEYTFHLPKRVLKTQEDILEFFEAVYSLHYGRPEKFIQQIEGFRITAENDTQQELRS